MTDVLDTARISTVEVIVSVILIQFTFHILLPNLYVNFLVMQVTSEFFSVNI